MVYSCVVPKCTSRYVKWNGIMLHRFPLANESLLLKWTDAIHLSDFKPKKSSRICSRHFEKSDYKDLSDGKFLLYVDAVPSVFDQAQTSRKRLLFLGNCNNSSMDERPLLTKLVKLDHCYGKSDVQRKNEIQKLQKKNRQLCQKIRRQKKKIVSLNDLIKLMKEKSLITDSVGSSLEENFPTVVQELFKSQALNNVKLINGRRYSEEIKKFALTLHFYSPRAYEFMQTVFTLPSIRSISNWTSSVNCDPGFFKDVFKHLGNQAANDSNVRDCALIVDGMSIKSSTVFDRSSGKYKGFIDYGPNLIIDDPEKVATEAIVFMLVGLRAYWKYPIGYILCEKMNSDILSSLLSKALTLSAEYGLNVVSVTCDGAPTNLDAMRKLGCNIGPGRDNFVGEFLHPSSGKPIYFIPDPCHMLKLARNALADVGTFLDGQKQVIKWEHIANLQDIQEMEGLKFGNKLSNHHLEFHRHKMNVKIAAQTLSSSVADAIDFLAKVKHPGYDDSSGTVHFIRMVDRLFDLLNSRNPMGKGFKKPLYLHDKLRWHAVFIDTIEYLLNLTDVDGTLLFRHRRKTFVIGFVICCDSIDRLATHLLSRPTDPFKYLLTYKTSQDHLELLFACIRGKNGFNNNPNVVQLVSSLRRILLRNAISSGRHSNCQLLESEPVGSIFSLKWSKRRSPLIEVEEPADRFDAYVADLCCQLDSVHLTMYQQSIIGYIAGHIIRKIKIELGCEKCASALIINVTSACDEHGYSFATFDSLSLIQCKNRGGLIFPSQPVVKIIQICENAFRIAVCGIDGKIPVISACMNLLTKLSTAVNRQLASLNVFCSLDEHDRDHEALSGDMHSTQLQKMIVNKYLTVRLLSYGRHYSKSVLQKHKGGIRQQSNKLVLFRHL